MKQFLSAWAEDASKIGIGFSPDATDGLDKSRGRTSPVMPALVAGSPARLSDVGVLLFLCPHQPSVCIAKVMNDMGTSLPQKTFLSYGHASVVMLLDDIGEAESVLEVLRDLLSGWEIWPYSRGLVATSEIVAKEPSPLAEWPQCVAVDTDQLTFEAAAQIRQFNANLRLLDRYLSRYLPESSMLITWLQKSVGDITSSLRQITETGGDDEYMVRHGISLESLLVEVNAVVTLYCSQISSGTIPIHNSRFPVGEYSLLGIGGMTRGAWRLYAHLNDTFSSFDHPGLFERQYRVRPPFDAFAPVGRLTFNDWYKSKLNIGQVADNVSGPPRVHMPYFSSRWGFHESMHSISVSWQCLHASAVKEWTLLTLSHEYIHAHVRQLVGKILDPRFADAENLVKRFNAKDVGQNTLDSLQMAYISAMVNADAGARAADGIRGGVRERLDSDLQTRISTTELFNLMNSEKELVDEICVHVLDFLYTYSAREEIYVDSIWSSWSLIPGVYDRMEYYLLRTLCALSAPFDTPNNEQLFDGLVERLRIMLEGMQSRARSRPVITRAIELLSSDLNIARLRLQFIFARYTVHFAVAFLYDPKLNAQLLRDDNTAFRNGETTYGLEIGEFRGESITSPVGFLIDRFPSYADQAGLDGSEYEGLWQIMQLI